MLSPSNIILRIQRLKGKQCRSRWGGSLWATSSRSTLFAKSGICVSGTQRVKNPATGQKIGYNQAIFIYSVTRCDLENGVHVARAKIKWFSQSIPSGDTVKTRKRHTYTHNIYIIHSLAWETSWMQKSSYRAKPILQEKNYQRKVTQTIWKWELSVFVRSTLSRWVSSKFKAQVLLY